MSESGARRIVRARSGGVCEVCGRQRATNFQHRKPRSQGGGWTVVNGLDVCGSGNASGCHGFIHQNSNAAWAAGWAVRATDDPALVPVLHWLYGRVWLDVEGGFRMHGPTPNAA